MGVTSYATLPFPPETHVFSTAFKLLQANSTLFKHLWLVTLIENAALPPGHADPFYIFSTQDSAHCMETDKEDLI